MKKIIFTIFTSFFLVASAQASQANELLLDPGFESGAVGENLLGGSTWRPYYNYDVAYAEIVNEPVKSGNKAIRFLNAGSGSGRGLYYAQTPCVFKNGDVYEFKGWFKTDKSGGATLHVTNQYDNLEGSPVTITSEWQEYTFKYTVEDVSNGFLMRIGTDVTMPYKISNYSNSFSELKKAVDSDTGINFVYGDNFSFKKVVNEFPESTKLITSRYGVSAVIDKENKLWMWGDNSFNQINSSEQEYFDEPCYITNNVKKVVCGDGHTVILTSDGMVYGWGSNIYGQISDEEKERILTPTLIIENAKDISAGSGFSVVIDNYDVLYGRGRNRFATFGVLNEAKGLRKVYSNVKSVEACAEQTFIIDNSGNLYATGFNLNGQLGNGTYLLPYGFKKIMSNVMQVSASDEYTLAVNSANELYGFGWNQYGCLGDKINGTNVPFKIADNIVFAGAGQKQALVINADGELLKIGGASEGHFNGKESTIDILSEGVTVCTGDDDVLMLKDGKLLAYDGEFKEVELIFIENEIYCVLLDGYRGGKLNVKIPAVKEPETVSLILAYYNNENKLIAVNTKKIFPSKDNVIDIEPVEGSTSCRIMLWESIDSLIPKSESLEVNVSSISTIQTVEGEKNYVDISGNVTGAGDIVFGDDDQRVTVLIRRKGADKSDLTAIVYLGQLEIKPNGTFAKRISFFGGDDAYEMSAYVADMSVEKEIVFSGK